MENKNTTCGNWTKVIIAPKLSEENVYVIYREDGNEVEVEISENGIRSRYFKLTRSEEEYFKNLLVNGDYKRKNT
jgi:hypothetical protein